MASSAAAAAAPATEKPLAQSLSTLTGFLENRILDNKRLNDENTALQLRVAALLGELHDKNLELASLTASLRGANEKVALLEAELQRQREHHTAALLAHASAHAATPASAALTSKAVESPERSVGGGALLGSLGSSSEALTTAAATSTGGGGTTTTTAAAAAATTSTTSAPAAVGSGSGDGSSQLSGSSGDAGSAANAAIIAERYVGWAREWRREWLTLARVCARARVPARFGIARAKKKGWRMSRPAGSVTPLKQVRRAAAMSTVSQSVSWSVCSRVLVLTSFYERHRRAIITHPNPNLMAMRTRRRWTWLVSLGCARHPRQSRWLDVQVQARHALQAGVETTVLCAVRHASELLHQSHGTCGGVALAVYLRASTHAVVAGGAQAEGKPQGSMEIACLTINPRVSIDIDLGDKNWYFSVVEDMSIIDPTNEQRRDYIFAADTEEEMAEWISLLQNAKKGIHRQAKHSLGSAAAAAAPAAAAAATTATAASTAATSSGTTGGGGGVAAALPDLSVPTVVTTTPAKVRSVTDEW